MTKKRIINSSEIRDVKDVQESHYSKINPDTIEKSFDEKFFDRFPRNIFRGELRENEDLWGTTRNPVISLSIGDHAILREISNREGISQHAFVTFLLRMFVMEKYGNIELHPYIADGKKKTSNNNVERIYEKYK